MEENNQEAELIAFLQKHSSKEFVQRILDPSLNKNPLQNSDGSTSTHSMAAEVDNNGNWFVFPTVINQNGKMVRYEDPFAALKENAKTGEFISFGKDADAAIKFSAGGYKTKAFNEYKPQAQAQQTNKMTLSEISAGNR
jgi:hypothetical protein